MKKKLAIVFSLLLTLSVLAGCKSNLPEQTTEDTKQSQTQATGQTQAPATEQTESQKTGQQEPSSGLKTGLGVITTLAKSTDASEGDGLAEFNSMIAAVTVNTDGKIENCVIDAVQSKINFSKDGKIVTDKGTIFKTKNELGTDYGMKSKSGIGKEWNEQAAAFAAYVVGKTVDEVKGIAVTSEGYAADTDLAAGITVYLGDFISVVEKAIINAKEMGASSGDQLGLGVTTSMAKSTDAGEKDGLAEANSTYTVVTTDAGGKITSCIIDASQGQVQFDTAGKIVSDISETVKSKNELGPGYGMAKVSGIGKEWNEQAAAYAAYVTGKTVDEVKSIAVTDGVPSDADLAASVTIHITDFNAVIEKAVTSAK